MTYFHEAHEHILGKRIADSLFIFLRSTIVRQLRTSLTCSPLLPLLGVGGAHLISLGEGFQTKHAPLPIPVRQHLCNKEHITFNRLKKNIFRKSFTFVVTDSGIAVRRNKR